MLPEPEYLETFIKEYNREVELEKKRALMEKHKNGSYSVQEILEAVENILGKQQTKSKYYCKIFIWSLK